VKETPFYLKDPPHPGEHVREYMEIHAMDATSLSQALGEPVYDLLDGRAKITPELAVKLAKLFGRPESLWNNLQANYDRAKEKAR
jgi:addiction module HigA family antidote